MTCLTRYEAAKRYGQIFAAILHDGEQLLNQANEPLSLKLLACFSSLAKSTLLKFVRTGCALLCHTTNNLDLVHNLASACTCIRRRHSYGP